MTKIKLKVGDLVIVRETRSMGGLPNGTIGLVMEEIPGVAPISPGIARLRWYIQWFTHKAHVGITFGRGLEVISESG
jgi:hypothetical protein